MNELVTVTDLLSLETLYWGRGSWGQHLQFKEGSGYIPHPFEGCALSFRQNTPFQMGLLRCSDTTHLFNGCAQIFRKNTPFQMGVLRNC